MTLTQLKYILAIAQTSSISTAAKLMFVSQPNMSNAIRELEEELGSTLFTRASRGVVPTIDGDGFLGYARQVIEQTSLIEEKYQGRARAKK